MGGGKETGRRGGGPVTLRRSARGTWLTAPRPMPCLNDGGSEVRTLPPPLAALVRVTRFGEFALLSDADLLGVVPGARLGDERSKDGREVNLPSGMVVLSSLEGWKRSAHPSSIMQTSSSTVRGEGHGSSMDCRGSEKVNEGRGIPPNELLEDREGREVVEELTDEDSVLLDEELEERRPPARSTNVCLRGSKRMGMLGRVTGGTIGLVGADM